MVRLSYLALVVVVVTILITLFGANLAHSECVTPEEMTIHVGKLLPDSKLRDFKSDEAKLFLGAFKFLDPQMDFDGDRVMAFTSSRLPGVGFAVFYQGCMTAHGDLQPETYRKLLLRAGIEGIGA